MWEGHQTSLPVDSPSLATDRILKQWRLLERSAASLALLIAQLGASAALPVADAILESRGMAESVHIETTDTECATHHDDRYCQAIRSLSGQRRTTQITGPAPAHNISVPSPVVRPTLLVQRIGLLGIVGPRAPPLA